jgi:hypothetical protein
VFNRSWRLGARLKSVVTSAQAQLDTAELVCSERVQRPTVGTREHFTYQSGVLSAAAVSAFECTFLASGASQKIKLGSITPFIAQLEVQRTVEGTDTADRENRTS